MQYAEGVIVGRRTALFVGAVALSCSKPPSPTGSPSATPAPLVSAPTAAPSVSPPSCSHNANDCSIALRIDFCSSSVLFTGDAEHDEEAQLDPHGHVTLLQVAHHGSETSTTPGFLSKSALGSGAGASEMKTHRRRPVFGPCARA